MINKMLIGHCSVDSGQILICDPCYVIGDEYGEDEYKNICEVTLDKSRFIKGAGQVMNGHAVASGTVWGDGRYPVYAEVDDKGTVLSLTIEFDEQPEEYEWECLRCGDEAEEGEEYCWRCEEIENENIAENTESDA